MSKHRLPEVHILDELSAEAEANVADAAFSFGIGQLVRTIGPMLTEQGFPVPIGSIGQVIQRVESMEFELYRVMFRTATGRAVAKTFEEFLQAT